MNLKIQKSIYHEISKLAETMTDAFAEDSKLYGEPPYGNDPASEIERSIAGDQCYSFHHGTDLIGGMYLKQIKADEYRLRRIWIDRKNQNKGMGTAILLEIEKMITGCKRLSLDTPYKSYRNHHFYEKNGFIKIGERNMAGKGSSGLDRNFTLFEYVKNFD